MSIFFFHCSKITPKVGKAQYSVVNFIIFKQINIYLYSSYNNNYYYYFIFALCMIWKLSWAWALIGILSEGRGHNKIKSIITQKRIFTYKPQWEATAHSCSSFRAPMLKVITYILIWMHFSVQYLRENNPQWHKKQCKDIVMASKWLLVLSVSHYRVFSKHLLNLIYYLARF